MREQFTKAAVRASGLLMAAGIALGSTTAHGADSEIPGLDQLELNRQLFLIDAIELHLERPADAIDPSVRHHVSQKGTGCGIIFDKAFAENGDRIVLVEGDNFLSDIPQYASVRCENLGEASQAFAAIHGDVRVFNFGIPEEALRGRDLIVEGQLRDEVTEKIDASGGFVTMEFEPEG